MIVPYLHRALVKPKQIETKTESGIIISLNERREQTAAEEGTIIAIGDTFGEAFNAKYVPQPGDRIYFARYAGKWIKNELGEDLVLLNDEDVVAVIKD